jgi:hypothetical protein
MARQRYETEEDLKLERAFADELEKKWNKTFFKLHWKYQLDFAITEKGEYKNITHWCEMKHRYFIDVGKYFPPKNICLSLDKWKMAMDMCYYTKKPFVFIIRCDKGKSGDYIYMHRYGDDKDFNVKIGGRIDKKRDAQDIEPIIEIPFKEFKKIGN